MRNIHIGAVAAAVLGPATAASGRGVSRSGLAMDRLPDWSLDYAADRHERGGLCAVDIKGFYAHNAGDPCPAPLEQILTGQKPPDRSCHALAVAVLCPQSGEQARWRGDTRRRSEADPHRGKEGHANEGADTAKRA